MEVIEEMGGYFGKERVTAFENFWFLVEMTLICNPGGEALGGWWWRTPLVLLLVPNPRLPLTQAVESAEAD